MAYGRADDGCRQGTENRTVVPSTGYARDLEGPADFRRARRDTSHAHAARRAVDGESTAIVLHRQDQPIVLGAERDGDVPCACVSRDVRQRFLCDAGDRLRVRPDRARSRQAARPASNVTSAPVRNPSASQCFFRNARSPAFSMGAPCN